MDRQFKYNKQSTNAKGIKTMDINYKDAFDPKNNEQLSIIHEPNIKYTEKLHFLNITSSARDTSQPFHYNYHIQLPTTYHNVVCVEMISATLPNVAGISSEPYIVFDIKEINCIDFITGDNNNSGFAVLPIKPTTNDFINPELGCMYHTTFNPIPAISLSRLTIKTRDVSGNLYDFGTPNGTFTKNKQHSFVLKITTSEVDKSAIQERRLY